MIFPAAAGILFAADLFCWHQSIYFVGPGLSTLLGNFQVFLVALAGFILFSEKIRYLRIQKGMTQAELAEKLNTTKQTIGKYENQVVTNLPLNRIQELADALDTTPAYLMGWGEEKPADASSADELDLAILSLVKQLPAEQKRFLLAQLRGVTGEK